MVDQTKATSLAEGEVPRPDPDLQLGTDSSPLPHLRQPDYIEDRLRSRSFLRTMRGLVQDIVSLPWRILSFFLAPFRNRKLRFLAITLILCVALWKTGAATLGLDWAAQYLGKPLQQRAAFTWQEKFESLENWSSPSALALLDDGDAVVVKGLSLHSKTLALENYRFSFLARPQKRSVGWVVRATGPGTYYAFKITDKGRGEGAEKYELVRYPVVDGHPADGVHVPFQLTAKNLPSDGFLDISVKVNEDQILTVVNGFGIDEWKHPKQNKGGLGFLAENGETFLLKALTISGNEDSTGLFLYGAGETFRSVRRNLENPPKAIHGAAQAAKVRSTDD